MVLKVKKPRSTSTAKKEALQQAAQEEVTRLNALVPLSLHQRLKIQAIKEGKGSSITGIIIKASNEYLSKYSKE